MKLGVDARMMIGSWQYRGIGRYILSMIQFLPKDDLVCFVPQNKQINEFDYISFGISFFPWWEQMVLPKLAKKQKLDFLLCPSITSPLIKIGNTKKIVVVYDLIFMQTFSELPASHSLYNNFGRLYRRYIAPKTYNSADILISISQYTKDQLSTRFKIPSNKIQVIPCSIADDWFVENPLPAEKRSNYIITVTGDAPSKNLPNLLLAFSMAIKKRGAEHFVLRIVGIVNESREFVMNLAAEYNIQNNVIIEKFVNNNELQELYRNAWASLTLSLYEGFGIPVVEAMASGTPVVCSNTTSLPEVAGEHAFYADPRSVESMSDAISKILFADTKDRDRIARLGQEYSRKFSAKVVTKQIADFWLEIKELNKQ